MVILSRKGTLTVRHHLNLIQAIGVASTAMDQGFDACYYIDSDGATDIFDINIKKMPIEDLPPLVKTYVMLYGK